MRFRRVYTPLRVGAALLAFVFLTAAPVAAMDAYEIEPGYTDHPLQGPEKAKGLVIWNHGVDGTRTQYTFPPPFIITALAARGWDVIKLNRNPTYENGWTSSGQKHIARLLEEAEAAKKKGYARIIFAGQSYGGAIALEAARTFPVYAVIAMAPGTGQETRNRIVTDTWTGAIATDTYAEVHDLKAERAVFVMPADDELLRNLDRAPKVREIMASKNIPYLMVDRQVHGHGGGYSKEFIPYASCAIWLLDPDHPRPPGEVHCFHDEFMEGATADALDKVKLADIWFGYADGNGQPVMVAVPKTGDKIKAVYSWGPDLLMTQKPGSLPAVPATRDGASLNLTFDGGAKVSLAIDGSKAKMTFSPADPKKDKATATLVLIDTSEQVAGVREPGPAASASTSATP